MISFFLCPLTQCLLSRCGPAYKGRMCSSLLQPTELRLPLALCVTLEEPTSVLHDRDRGSILISHLQTCMSFSSCMLKEGMWTISRALGISGHWNKILSQTRLHNENGTFSFSVTWLVLNVISFTFAKSFQRSSLLFLQKRPSQNSDCQTFWMPTL